MSSLFCERSLQILCEKGPFLRLPLLCLLLLLIFCLVVLFGFVLCFSSFSSDSFSPTFALLFALFAFYTFFAIGSALFEVFKHRSAKNQQNHRLAKAHRLRPLLFVTCAVSLLGFPPLLLLPLLCRLFSFCSFFPFSTPFALFSSCSCSSLFSTFLSLLITAFVPLRPLLQRKLHKMRRDALWTQFLCQNEPITVTTLFNQFAGVIDRIAKDQNEEEKAFFKEWRRSFEAQLEGHNGQKSAEKRGKASDKGNAEKGTAKKRETKAKRKRGGRIQFSEVSLIREVTITMPETVRVGPVLRYAGGTVYVPVARDFSVRMNSLGRIVPKSVRQIPYVFATTKQIYYFVNRWAKSRGKTTQKAKEIITAQEKRAATAEEHGDGYATIGGEEEADKVPTMAFKAATQLRPRLPTTPIPCSLPVSLLASPSTPLQEEFVPILAAPSHLARANSVDQQNKSHEKAKRTENMGTRKPCWWQFETEAQALAHWHTISGQEKATSSKSSDGYDEAEEVTDTEE